MVMVKAKSTSNQFAAQPFVCGSSSIRAALNNMVINSAPNIFPLLVPRDAKTRKVFFKNHVIFTFDFKNAYINSPYCTYKDITISEYIFTLFFFFLLFIIQKYFNSAKPS